MINLDEEVELLHRYLSLEKVRYEDKFEFDLTVDPGLDRKKIFINTMLLQPFVENALQHGLFHRPQGGLIHVDFKKENTNLHVTLTDNGIGIDKSIELKKANTKIISSRAMEIFYEKLEIINKINPDSISFSHRNLDNNHPEYKGTVVNIIFNNVCS
jgi:LytS/YehU family sensor histidine kinase